MGMESADLFAIPTAVSRLGEELFLKLPLYRAQKVYRPIYINEELFQKYFGALHLSSRQEKADFLSKYFSCSLTPSAKDSEQVGWAYVDRQADPSHISLGGNLGSGRAYYLGENFNIKGEKTPLATSDIRRLSDGYLEAERGIWETIVANALKNDFESGASPILTILDMEETCSVVWREEPVRRVKIVRIDNGGTLDRISHIFYNKRQLTKHDLLHTAETFARLEAEKYIHRILHGAWSPGNISPNGDLIDLDTACAVKGRSPSFSATPWHQENYFGFEYKGQARILEMLADDPDINREKVGAEELTTFMQRRKDEFAAEYFVSLMGFKNTKRVIELFHDDITALYRAFRDLAALFYPKLDGLSLKNENSNLIHVVDFSCFFRFYPILKRTHSFSQAVALALMMDNGSLQDPFVKTYLPIIREEDVEEYFESVLKNFLHHFVLTPATLQKARDNLESFVGSYDDLFEKILDVSGENPLEIEARAYLINEDRFYLFPYHTPSYTLSQKIGCIEDYEIQRWMDIYITAISRRPEKNARGHWICDIRLYNEGYFYRLLDGKGGHHTCFCLFKQSAYDELAVDDDKAFKFLLNGYELVHTFENFSHEIHITGSRQDNKMLILSSGRDQSLVANNVTLSFKGNALTLSDISSNNN